MARGLRQIQALSRDFRNVWAAHTVSQFGTQITVLALPFTAALTLDATPFQMGILTATSTLPTLLFGLMIGVWVDRWPKHRVLVAADLVRAAALLLVPLLALAHALSVAVLIAVAFLTGVANMFFNVAMSASLPRIIGRQRLVEGNALLEASRSAATAVGPSLGGVLVQVLGAPFALLVDAASFLVSALFLRGVRVAQPVAARPRQAFWPEVRLGFQEIGGRPILFALARTATLWNLAVYINVAALILYVTRVLGLSAAQFGVITTMLGVGMLLGTAVIGGLQRRFGVGTVFMVAGFMATLSSVGVLGAHLVPGAGRFAFLLVSEFLSGVGYIIFAISTASVRQAATPDDLQGKLAATFQFLIMGGIPVGALVGGVVGSQVGLWSALMVGATGQFVAWGLLWFSPVRTLETMPASSEEPEVSHAPG